MAEWFNFSTEFTITTAGTMGTPVQVFAQDDIIGDRTVVDGYVTLVTDTDNLCQVRMYAPTPAFTSSGDFAFSTPARREAVNWYWFNCALGPMVFRLRSKRTFRPDQEWWIACAKLSGGTQSTVRVGIQALFSP